MSSKRLFLLVEVMTMKIFSKVIVPRVKDI